MTNAAEQSDRAVDISALIKALKAALPYVESIEARQPTTQANCARQREAARTASYIRGVLKVVEQPNT